MSDLSISSDSGPPRGDRLAWLLLGGMGALFAAVGVRVLLGTDAGADRIGGAVFSVAGCGMLAFSVALRRAAIERDALRRRDPARPWRWRQAWLSGRIESDARQANVVLWVFTVLWNLMSLPVWLGMAGPAIFFAWMFPAAGLVMLFFALRTSLRAQRHGRSVLVMESIPGVLGGTLAGEVHAASDLGDTRTLMARLSCQKRHSKNRTEELWQDERPIAPDPALLAHAGSVVPVSFVIPYGLPDSNESDVTWYLELSARAAGPDYHARFEVPVFETEASRHEIDARAAAPAPAPRPALLDAPERVAEGSRIRIARHDGGLELVFPACRTPGASAMLFGAWLFWSFLTLMFWFGWDGASGIPPKLILLGCGLFLTWGLLDSVFGWVRLRVTPGRLERSHRWLGIGHRQVFHAEDVEAFTLEHAGRLGRTDLYNLRVQPPRGRSRILARVVRGKRLAESLRDWMEKAFQGEA